MDRAGTNTKVEARTRVLLADDDPGVVKLLRQTLEEAGYIVDVAETGEAARDHLAETIYEVAVVDLVMPGNEELEVLHTLNSLPSPLPVVVITGKPRFETAVEALRLHAVDYLSKPFDEDAFLAAVTRGVETTERERDLSATLHTLQGAVASRRQAGESEGGPDGELRSQVVARLTAQQRDSLTRRELDVLCEFAEHGSINGVADSLGVSHHTVRTHIKSIFRKLEVRSQVELTRKLTGLA